MRNARREWRRACERAKPSVVVATRSGVFAPVQNLGLILVDEEHDGSYKQQDAPRYNGRDVAVVRREERERGRGPGLRNTEPRNPLNAERGKYTRLVLPERIQQRPMPEVQLIDMRQEFLDARKNATFSRALIDAVTERLANGEQAMLMLNRRGFSSFVTCRACGERVECANCSVTLTYHKRDRRLLCQLLQLRREGPKPLPEVR